MATVTAIRRVDNNAVRSYSSGALMNAVILYKHRRRLNL